MVFFVVITYFTNSIGLRPVCQKFRERSLMFSKLVSKYWGRKTIFCMFSKYISLSFCARNELRNDGMNWGIFSVQNLYVCLSLNELIPVPISLVGRPAQNNWIPALFSKAETLKPQFALFWEFFILKKAFLGISIYLRPLALTGAFLVGESRLEVMFC